MSRRGLSKVLPLAICAVAALAFGALLFKHLSYPIFWEGEAVTAGFGTRVLEYGYPKVHGPKSALYATSLSPAVAIEPSLDAYLGAPWGPFYFAAFAELLASGEEDPWARTGRMRAPFALLGAGGLCVLLSALLPLVGGDRSRRAWAAAAFLGLCAVSISLLLHLREVGSLAPTLFLLALALLLLIRRHVRKDLSELAFVVGFGFTLFLLFISDYAVFAGVAATELLLALRRGLAGSGSGAGLRGCAADLGALLLAGVALAPLLSLYGLSTVVAVTLAGEGATPSGYGGRLLAVILHLLRYEWLLPVLAARLALTGLRALSRGAPASGKLAERLAAADLLSLFVLIQVLGVAYLPAFLERNAVPLGPILGALLVLDAVSLLEVQRLGRGARRRLGIAGLALLALGVLVGLGLRVPEVGGRLHELRHRYRGPLDHVLSYVLEHYEDPSRTVVATTAEGAVFGYYLDAHVLVDTHGLTLERDFLLQPDLIIPRSGGSSRVLGLLAVRSALDQEDLPVMNLARNNVPTLSERDAGGLVHRFESADLAEGQAGLPLLELRRGERGGL